MHQGKLVFSQLMTYLPLTTFRRCVAAHRGEHKVKDFSCLDQFFAMAFAQLTYRESLRDIEVNLRAQANRLYHMGFRCSTISRNTLANANATRPWQIYADFAQHLIAMARPLYASELLDQFTSTIFDSCSGKSARFMQSPWRRSLPLDSIDSSTQCGQFFFAESGRAPGLQIERPAQGRRLVPGGERGVGKHRVKTARRA